MLPWVLLFIVGLYALQLRFRLTYFIRKYYRKADYGVAHHVQWVETEIKKLKFF